MPFPLHGGTERRPCTITKKENKHGGILGIGGIFFKSANKQQVKEWYAKHLGLADSGHGDSSCRSVKKTIRKVSR